MEIIEVIVSALGSLYDEGKLLYAIVGAVLTAWTVHNAVYVVTGCFFTRKFAPAKKQHKYAILIPARNEEKVVGNLIESIHRQDYPKELLTVFVIADNCTDGTAETARKHGAAVYERTNPNERTKGFALKYLFECIERDYGIQSFEGYFVFDADNLLKRDYISRMNDSFDSGVKIITSFRNTKNFDENWIASTYALHWVRSSRGLHRARSVFRLATNIQGTGFLFANELVKDGWKYTSLTEDRAFTADAVAMGYEISYNDEAEFYDEQPTSLKVALRQRLRWSKGHLLAFLETGPLLFKNIFLGISIDKGNGKRNQKVSFAEQFRRRWASFDILGLMMPKDIIKLSVWLLAVFVLGACCAYSEGFYGALLENVNVLGMKIIDFLNLLGGNFKDVEFNLSPGILAAAVSTGVLVFTRVISSMINYITNALPPIYLFFIERKRIKKIPLHKKIWYMFTFPIFDIIGKWTMRVAIFKKVEWKQIPHDSKVTIGDIEEERQQNNKEEKELVNK